MATIQTNFLFDSHVRPAWIGPITIADNKPTPAIDLSRSRTPTGTRRRCRG